MSGFIAINAVVVALSLIQGAGLLAYLLLGSSPGEARAQAADAPHTQASAMAAAATPDATPAGVPDEQAARPAHTAPVTPLFRIPSGAAPPTAEATLPAGPALLPCGLRAPPSA